MSAPKPATVLLILALVAVVALFAVGVGVRAPDDRPVDLQALEERWLGSPRKVGAGEVEGDPCRRPLGPGQRCSFEIESAWTLVRTLEVRSQDAVTVVLTPAGEDRDVRVDLRPARAGDPKSVDLQVGRKGGRVEITCRDPALSTPGLCAVSVALGATG